MLGIRIIRVDSITALTEVIYYAGTFTMHIIEIILRGMIINEKQLEAILLREIS